MSVGYVIYVSVRILLFDTNQGCSRLGYQLESQLGRYQLGSTSGELSDTCTHFSLFSLP